MNCAEFFTYPRRNGARTDLLSQNDDENNRIYFESILSILFTIQKKNI